MGADVNSISARRLVESGYDSGMARAWGIQQDRLSRLFGLLWRSRRSWQDSTRYWWKRAQIAETRIDVAALICEESMEGDGRVDADMILHALQPEEFPPPPYWRTVLETVREFAARV